MNFKLLFISGLVSVSFLMVSAQEGGDNRKAQCCADGASSFKSFLSKTIKYPVRAQENNLQGQVIIDFIVGKDGGLKDFVVVKDFDKECTEYAIRVLETSPEWLPAVKDGKAVCSKQSVTIYFKLIGADTEMDVEPHEGDIIVWGYGTTKKGSLTKGKT